ncbi:MAG: TolC family protein, partial [Bacteroidia bacterium]|nr:TolC family protein [Bacteroidia bacterium]
MKNNQILLLCFIFNCTTAIAQDTSKAIGLPAVLQLVGQNHPMVKYSALIPFKAGAALTIARGNFDPQFNYFRDQKYYDNTNYYELQQLGLQLNTLSPISINAGVEQANGTYLNPEEKTPSGGLYYSGVSVSLLRNALTDKRRTLLRQSKLIREQSFFEQQIVLNELGREIIGAYLDWVMAEKEKAIYTRAITSVEERLVAIRQEVIAGSKAEIDTLETYVL